MSNKNLAILNSNKTFRNIDPKHWFYIIIIWMIISLLISFILGGIFYAAHKKKDDKVTFFGMTTEFIATGFYLGLVGIILTVLHKEYNISVLLFIFGTFIISLLLNINNKVMIFILVIFGFLTLYQSGISS